MYLRKLHAFCPQPTRPGTRSAAYIYIYIYIYMGSVQRPRRCGQAVDVAVHPVSITRFPLARLSPGSGLLRNPFVHR